MPTISRFRVVGVLGVALCLVMALAAETAARWVVHDGGTTTDVRDIPGGGADDVCADQIHGLAGYAEAIGPGADPAVFPIPPWALTATSYEVYSGPPGVDLYVNDSLPEFQVGYDDEGGIFREADLAATFTSPPRRRADPITLGTDFYVFTFAPFSAPLTGVRPGDTVGIKPHPTSPLATVADVRAVNCGDRGFLRWWETDVDFCPATGGRVLAGDVTGDRRSDLVCHHPTSGALRIATASPGGSFTSAFRNGSTACRTARTRLLLADVNGDRRADLVCQNRGTSRVTVAPGRKAGRFAKAVGRGRLGMCRSAGSRLLAGDVDRDRRADLVCHTPRKGVTAVALATKRGAFPKVHWTSGPSRFCRSGQLLLGDLTGDRRDDLLCHRTGSGTNVLVQARKNGRFGKARRLGRLSGCGTGTQASLGDVDRDGRADLVCHVRGDGSVRVALARARGRLPKVDFARRLGLCAGPSARLRVADVSGDRRADLVCSARGTGIVTVSYSDL